jgi:hypothetical protein
MIAFLKPGHWIAEERPDFLVKELAAFFSE